MKTIAEIKQLSSLRLEEADILCTAGKYDGAFYLAGYSVELMLKAKICENFDIDDLFSESVVIDTISKKLVSEVSKSVKTHDLNVLFIYSGLVKKFQLAKANEPKLMQTYGYLMSISMSNNQRISWSEQVRYLPIGSQKPLEVQTFIQLLKDNEGLLEWMKNN